jgi:hypothetical protein
MGGQWSWSSPSSDELTRELGVQLAQAYREFTRDGLRVGERLTAAVRGAATLIDLAEAIARATAEGASVGGPGRVDSLVREFEALASPGGRQPNVPEALAAALASCAGQPHPFIDPDGIRALAARAGAAAAAVRATRVEIAAGGASVAPFGSRAVVAVALRLASAVAKLPPAPPVDFLGEVFRAHRLGLRPGTVLLQRGIAGPACDAMVERAARHLIALERRAVAAQNAARAAAQAEQVAREDAQVARVDGQAAWDAARQSDPDAAAVRTCDTAALARTLAQEMTQARLAVAILFAELGVWLRPADPDDSSPCHTLAVADDYPGDICTGTVIRCTE